MRRLGSVPALVATVALAVAGPTAPAGTAAPAPTAVAASYAVEPAARTVLERRVIGRSVRGRAIWAYRLGEPGAPRAVALATMHGDEPAPRAILRALRDGAPVRGVDLWVVPTYNPDGLARGTRTNARGVDLNRNFPQRWRDLDGRYESGPRPASEPETRAVMGFLDDVDPRWVVSFHQPLHGVDTDTKRPAFARRLATELRLPRKTFDCGGVCHGTMTMWFNARHRGAAVTVEYGRAPGRHRMRVEAPRQLLRALGGSR
ncbi:M14 family zinc carboxypeptidase [Nocardioides perillae]|uniref:Murein tripeptide amidase MpaA n=1 Tax=Nocardioides perillae TaxID=1119534 RepID=A0A7Y9UN02_9ACTN|nr:murein tripeptide amidase MpaA [Nocardioides perillae]